MCIMHGKAVKFDRFPGGVFSSASAKISFNLSQCRRAGFLSSLSDPSNVDRFSFSAVWTEVTIEADETTLINGRYSGYLRENVLLAPPRGFCLIDGALNKINDVHQSSCDGMPNLNAPSKFCTKTQSLLFWSTITSPPHPIAFQSEAELM